MTYAALLEAYGWERFDADVRAAGATSLIVADLPVDERPELRRVQLVAPTSTDERIRMGAETTDGWLYLVTLTGTTGARSELSPHSPVSSSVFVPSRTSPSMAASGSPRRSRQPRPPRSQTESSWAPERSK